MTNEPEQKEMCPTHPRRRTTDCEHADRATEAVKAHLTESFRGHNLSMREHRTRAMLLYYLVSSAAIAVLVLVFHLWRIISTMEHSMTILMKEQNELLKTIHESVHAEGQTIREVMHTFPGDKGAKK